MRFVLFQPDIAPNVGTILRLAACLKVGVDIIEPSGFPWDSKTLRRSAMDYWDHVKIIRHKSWAEYIKLNPQEINISLKEKSLISVTDKFAYKPKSRLILLTTRSSKPYFKFEFSPNDRIMVGRESSGVPKEVHNTVDARLTIPINQKCRSINVAIALAIVAGEAIRQTNLYPRDPYEEI